MVNIIMYPDKEPPYSVFRRFASFVPDIADFALTERQCNKLLAALGLDMCAGYGLGDIHILFNQVSKSGCLTFNGLSQLYRILVARKGRVEDAIKTEPATMWTSERPSTAPGFSSSCLPGSFIHRPMPDSSSMRPSSPSRQNPGIPPQKASVSFSELMKPTLVHEPPPRSLHADIRRPDTGSFASISGNPSPSSTLTGLAAVMACKDPPIVLRESIPLPACEFSIITTKMQGAKSLMLNHETRNCITALKEIFAEWELLVEEKQAKEQSRKKVSDALASSGANLAKVPLEGTTYLFLMGACCSMALGDFIASRRLLSVAESQFNTQILGINHAYYYCIFYIQGLVDFYDGKFEEALRKFETARDLSDQIARDRNDPSSRKNSACCLNNIGACCQMLGRRAEAVASYRAAVQFLRNNVGLNSAAAEGAMSNLNRAIRSSFALAPVRPRSASPSYGALRPTPLGSPQVSSSMVGVSGLPVTVTSSGGRLQAFLRQAVTLTTVTPLLSTPVWATKSNGEEAAKKKAAKGGKDKDKADGKDGKKKGGKKKKKAKKGFTISYPLTLPHTTYGVANVTLAAKKKTKAKKKAN